MSKKTKDPKEKAKFMISELENAVREGKAGQKVATPEELIECQVQLEGQVQSVGMNFSWVLVDEQSRIVAS